MSKLKNLEDVLLEELKDLYSAEKQLLKALPKMEKAACCTSLQEAFADHQLQTEEHCERLNEIETLIGSKLSGKTCKAMKGLVEEGQDVMKEKCESESLQDALLIGAARRVEHYEVAAYSTARAMAKELGLTKIEKLLGKTLDEETEADGILTAILKTEVLPECCETEETDDKTKVSSKSASKKNGSLAQPVLMVGLLSLSFMLTSIVSAENVDGLKSTNSPSPAYSDVKNPASEKLDADPFAADKLEAERYDADNTGKNIREKNARSETAEAQDLSKESAEVLATIRQEILDIEDLSVNGQNVKILLADDTVMNRGVKTHSGTVTLKGPVASENEKEMIAESVQRVAGSYAVDNQLEVTRN